MLKKIIKDKYIVAIVSDAIEETSGTEIAEEEYNKIMEIIKTPREEAPEGYVWKLRNDTLEYELAEVENE